MVKGLGRADRALVNQHDDEEEQHHDPARVNEDLDGSDEFGLLENEDAGHHQEGCEEKERRMDRVLRDHDGDPRHDREN
jgi:hypothetical protein